MKRSNSLNEGASTHDSRPAIFLSWFFLGVALRTAWVARYLPAAPKQAAHYPIVKAEANRLATTRPENFTVRKIMAEGKDPTKVTKGVDLHLVCDDDMIEELASRHHNGVFLFYSEKDEGSGMVKRSSYKGPLSRLVGASERVYRKHLREADRADDK
jgi:hypothetical protein